MGGRIAMPFLLFYFPTRKYSAFCENFVNLDYPRRDKFRNPKSEIRNPKSEIKFSERYNIPEWGDKITEKASPVCPPFILISK
jgi:hypothetical protein